MKNRHAPALRIVAIALALIAYAFVAHYASNLSPAEAVHSAVIATLPFAAIAVLLCWRARHRYLWLFFCASLATLVWRNIDFIAAHLVWIYFIQHAAANAMMALVFGRSLVGDRVPLCSRIAALVHGGLEPTIARYTRQVTVAWTMFFVLNAAVSILLFAYAPVTLWSVFVNVLPVPLAVLMFTAEYCVRLRRLPDFKHASILDGIRLYRRAAAHPTA